MKPQSDHDESFQYTTSDNNSDERQSGVQRVVGDFPEEAIASEPVNHPPALPPRFAFKAAVVFAYVFVLSLSVGILIRKPTIDDVRHVVRISSLRSHAPATPTVQPSHPAALVRETIQPPVQVPAIVQAPGVVQAPVPTPAATPAVGSTDSYYTAVMDTVRVHQERVQYCSQKRSGSLHVMAGNVPITIVIEQSGRVHTAGYGNVDASQIRAVGCLTSAIKRWNFPSHTFETDHPVIVRFDLRDRTDPAAQPE
jgi:hypothetical protein